MFRTKTNCLTEKMGKKKKKFMCDKREISSKINTTSTNNNQT